jgi:hypothetical protein
MPASPLTNWVQTTLAGWFSNAGQSMVSNPFGWVVLEYESECGFQQLWLSGSSIQFRLWFLTIIVGWFFHTGQRIVFNKIFDNLLEKNKRQTNIKYIRDQWFAP